MRKIARKIMEALKEAYWNFLQELRIRQFIRELEKLSAQKRKNKK